MKTFEYPIQNDELALKIILDVVEDLTAKQGLGAKQKLQTSLLAEELFGMTNAIQHPPSTIRKNPTYTQKITCNPQNTH